MNDSTEQLKNGAKNMLTNSNDALESALSLFVRLTDGASTNLRLYHQIVKLAARSIEAFLQLRGIKWNEVVKVDGGRTKHNLKKLFDACLAEGVHLPVTQLSPIMLKYSEHMTFPRLLAHLTSTLNDHYPNRSSAAATTPDFAKVSVDSGIMVEQAFIQEIQSSPVFANGLDAEINTIIREAEEMNRAIQQAFKKIEV
jgi:hypothetical protein